MSPASWTTSAYVPKYQFVGDNLGTKILDFQIYFAKKRELRSGYNTIKQLPGASRGVDLIPEGSVPFEWDQSGMAVS